jgi:hypothetical protein
MVLLVPLPRPRRLRMRLSNRSHRTKRVIAPLSPHSPPNLVSRITRLLYLLLKLPLVDMAHLLGDILSRAQSRRTYGDELKNPPAPYPVLRNWQKRTHPSLPIPYRHHELPLDPL